MEGMNGPKLKGISAYKYIRGKLRKVTRRRNLVRDWNVIYGFFGGNSSKSMLA